ncbi:hypothetical protein FHS68_002177 [Dyadobacter arcticus]|uniref:Uncharacterized protein n=1 Tax=Dyadobacter arcticus TaxID=1078754 RepID=A0ABX0UJB5_9BACT|nr:hypothetical protein [Dyadobacter arcticus]
MCETRILNKDPFYGFKLPKHEVDRSALSEAELKRLILLFHRIVIC